MSLEDREPRPPATGRLAWRLYVRHWRRLLFFSSCIAIGVAFLFGIDNLLYFFERGVADHARELMAADVEVSSARPFDPQESTVFGRLARQGVRQTRLTEFASMLAIPKSPPFLVSVEAVEDGYPFYGAVETEPPGRLAEIERGGKQCLIEESIALEHGVRPGDLLRLGRADFEVAGIIRKQSDRPLTSLAFGPRVLVPLSSLQATGLLQFGSRIEYRRLFASPDPGDPARSATRIKERLEREIPDPHVRIVSYTESESNTRAALQRSTAFFVLVSLIGLVLGGIGMSSALTMFLTEQIETAAVLRCLGLAPRHVARIYGALCLAVGAQGAVLGVAAGWGVSRIALSVVRNMFGLQLGANIGVSGRSVLLTLAIACALSAGLNGAKVRALARLAPLDALRERLRGLPVSRGFAVLAWMLGLAGVFGYAWFEAGSLPIARDFALALAGAAVGIAALTAGILWIVTVGLSSWGARAPFALRHGLLQLTRQRGRSVLFLSTLSAGFGLLGALGLVRHSLSREILLGRAQNVPDLFLIDVQKDQVESVGALAKSRRASLSEFAPLVRARLVAVNGRPLERRIDGTGGPRERGDALLREYNLTYKDALHASERVSAGRFWRPGETAPQFSVEEGYARRAGFKLGDTLRFDVQGRMIEGPVSSLRKVEWTSLRPNFFVILPKAVLEPAPQVFVGSLKFPDTAAAASFRTELFARFPNISAIDIRSILDTLWGLLGVILRTLDLLAWFCVFVGLLVLGGTVALGKKDRQQAAALFRALGCRPADVVRIDATEFIAIGAAAFAIAWGAALGVAWVVARRMDVRFSVDLVQLLPVLAAALVLPPVVGLFVNRSAYRGNILATLREDQ